MTVLNRRNRVMIIVWSWTQGGNSKVYEEWSISGSQNTEDRIITLDEKAGILEDPILPQIIQAHLATANIFVFLHRSHGYSSKDIQQLLSSNRPLLQGDQELRCFLFGEGNDFIYLAKNPRGLLGTRGTFSANFQADDPHTMNPNYLDAVLDIDQRIIKKEHFEAVWTYYGSAFKAKILELKESLLSTLLPQHYDEDGKERNYYELIRQPDNKLLFLRLLSFVGKIRKDSDLEEELKKFEINNKKSYLFDDCNAHFKGIYGEEEQKVYQLLSDEIKSSILSRKQSSNLISMRNHFDALLEVMPEASFY